MTHPQNRNERMKLKNLHVKREKTNGKWRRLQRERDKDVETQTELRDSGS